MQQYGLVGYPLTHSFSPNFFQNKFLKENIEAKYSLFPIKNIQQIKGVFTQQASLNGLNVTVPYKSTIIPFLDELDHDAAQIGAVNCIKFEGDKKIGFNTDWLGFRESILPLLKPYMKYALILGSGGSAKAASYALKTLNIKANIVSRNRGELTYNDLDELIIKQNPIIVNCTPLGMYPNIATLPDLPYKHIEPYHLLFDLVYNPAQTAFLKQGVLQGATVINGLEMLHIQAQKSWKIWNSKV